MNLNYVRLDVGHYLFVCHKSTLEKFPDSVLAKYVKPEFDRRLSASDYITIDRDGKHFGSILNFMRDPSSLNLSELNRNDLTDLMREADFYCLTELVEECEKEFVQRDKITLIDTKTDSLNYVPVNRRLEIVFGQDTMRLLLDTTKKQTIVISYENMRRYHIASWIEELVRLCDHQRFDIYCFSGKKDEIIFSGLRGQTYTVKDFWIVNYDPNKKEPAGICLPPSNYEKFRTNRDRYKCKVFRFWFLMHNPQPRVRTDGE